MAVTGGSVEVLGLTDLIKDFKGSAFRDMNNALRAEALTISTKLVPLVVAAVRASNAPQADRFAATVRPKRDRVPLVAVGAVNPKFSKSFTRRGAAGTASSQHRRGAMAHGVLFGPKGGHRRAFQPVNYYRIPRNDDFLAAFLADNGVITRHATNLYLEALLKTMRQRGWSEGSLSVDGR